MSEFRMMDVPSARRLELVCARCGSEDGVSPEGLEAAGMTEDEWFEQWRCQDCGLDPFMDSVIVLFICGECGWKDRKTCLELRKWSNADARTYCVNWSCEECGSKEGPTCPF